MKKDDHWLDSWVNDITDRSVLELGAGSGIDTQSLARMTDQLIAGDLNPRHASVTHLDHREPLPFENDKFDVVVASLTLHYFEWRLTVNIVNEIQRVLKSEGLLICRVNSIQDIHYGAVGYPEIETRLFQVKEQLKRFFTRDDIVKLFSDGWTLTKLTEKQIDRYDKVKTVWEFGGVNTKPSA